MKSKSPEDLFEEALSKYGAKFRIDERNAKILREIAESPKTFKEIEVNTSIPKPTLARRLGELIRLGYVKNYDTLRKSFYEPRRLYAIDQYGFPNLLRKILDEMEREYENLRVYIALFKSLLEKV